MASPLSTAIKEWSPIATVVGILVAVMIAYGAFAADRAIAIKNDANHEERLTAQEKKSNESALLVREAVTILIRIEKQMDKHIQGHD